MAGYQRAPGGTGSRTSYRAVAAPVASGARHRGSGRSVVTRRARREVLVVAPS